MTAYSERIGERIHRSVTGETYSAYVPKPLPPIPSIEMEKIYPLLDQANIALGRLDGSGQSHLNSGDGTTLSKTQSCFSGRVCHPSQ